jgi:hypothetical protein
MVKVRAGRRAPLALDSLFYRGLQASGRVRPSSALLSHPGTVQSEVITKPEPLIPLMIDMGAFDISTLVAASYL